MRYSQPYCAALLAVALLTPFVSASEPGQKTLSQNIRSEDPIVQAVKHTIHGVVAIRVPRSGEKDMIGSGVIVDGAGLIVTNRHVTGGKRYVKVRLHDRTDLDGEVVFHDPDLDLAIVSVKSKKSLHTLALGSADDMFLAEKAIAIGSPYGYEGTVSVGIISALNREIRMPNDVLMTGLIQTTAAINPGNSGGPLININGEVIGINVAMRDGAQNIAFAINAATVDSFLKDYYRRRNRVSHGIDCEKKVIAEVGGDRQIVIVKHASHGELKHGDQIVTMAGQKVANEFEIERALWHSKPGEKVEVNVLRDNHKVCVMVTLAASEGAGQAAVVSTEIPAATANVRAASQR
jgi:serine protease Do